MIAVLSCSKPNLSLFLLLRLFTCGFFNSRVTEINFEQIQTNDEHATLRCPMMKVSRQRDHQ